MSIDGMSSCIHAVKDIEKGNIHHCFIEMSACPGSCIGGPAMEKNHRAPVRDYITVRRFAEDAGDNDFKYDALSENELSKKSYLSCFSAQYGRQQSDRGDTSQNG